MSKSHMFQYLASSMSYPIGYLSSCVCVFVCIHIYVYMYIKIFEYILRYCVCVCVCIILNYKNLVGEFSHVFSKNVIFFS